MEGFIGFIVFLLCIGQVILYRNNRRLKKGMNTLEAQVKELNSKIGTVTIDESKDTVLKEEVKETGAEEATIKVEKVETITTLEKVVTPETPKALETVVNRVKETQSEAEVVPPKAKVKRTSKKKFLSVESIISKLGITLLLIGVGYIFKLVYDSGYVTEELAVFLGVFIGFGLFGIGYKVKDKGRMILAHVLYGGGSATLYITTYAAYQGYGLISGIAAFTLMVAVTGIIFFVAIMTNSLSTAIIGLVGALLTPFIIQLKQLGLLGVGIYIVILAIATMSIYIFKRWRSLKLTNIIGTYLVIMSLIGEDLSTDKSNQIVLLLIMLLLVYNGIEYILYFTKQESSRFPVISYSLFVTLPLITAVDIDIIKDFSSVQWSVIFAVAGIMYFLLMILFYKRLGNTLVSDIQVCLGGFFTIFAVVLYFEGSIVAVGIMAVGMIYFLLGRKTSNRVITVLGHIIMGLGMCIAFGMLLSEMSSDNYSVGYLITRMLVIAMMLGAGVIFRNYRSAQWIYNCIALLGYGLIGYCGWIYHLSNTYLVVRFDNFSTLALMIIAYGIYIAVLYTLYRQLQWLPELGIFVIALLPILIKLVSVVETMVVKEVDIYGSLSFVIYGVLVYVIAHLLFNEKQQRALVGMKIFSYMILFLTIIIDAWIMSERIEIGILLSLVVVLFINYLEPHKGLKGMNVYYHIMRGLWCTISIFFLLLFEVYPRLELLKIVAIFMIMGCLLWQLVIKRKRLPLIVLLTLHVFVYMVATSKLFEYFDNGAGTTTLLWAAYVIALLAFSVVKSKKNIVSLSLGLIIFVAVKFILVDLTEVSGLWKIITSMGFGTGLLILSYFLQPILKKEED